jgi:tetratricopeptide (TPR) repeat protein
MAFVLLLIGLPIVLATAVVQEGAPGSRAGAEPEPAGEPEAAPEPASGAAPAPGGSARVEAPAGAPGPPSTPAGAGVHRLLTWRNAILGGVAAFALLGFSVAVYFLMWTTGIGPVGNLVAQGLIAEGERVVLATFADGTDEGLGDVVTEALRVDLGGTSILTLMEEADVAPVLARMQVAPGTPLTGELAREVAIREGIEAVLDGEVARVGTGYLITAALRDASTGRSLAGFRVTAARPDDLIPSIDRLSRDIREKSGESLRSIRAGEPLEQVTTRSLEALRLFSEAHRAFERSDYARTIPLLEEAVALDPEFAMAWRRMAAALFNTGTDPARLVEAATQAFRHRHRLTPRERHLAEAFYYWRVEMDRARRIAAYENVLRIAPDDRAALNNLGVVYLELEDFERATTLYRKAVDGPGRSNTAFQNLVVARIGAQDLAGAAQVYREYQEAYPDDQRLIQFEVWLRFLEGDLDGAIQVAERQAGDPSLPAFGRSGVQMWLGALAYWRGRLDEGRSHLLAAERSGAEVSPGFALGRRAWTAHFESSLGDPEWAHRHLAEALDDGRFWEVDPDARPWMAVAITLAELGDRERGVPVLEAWDEHVAARGGAAEARFDQTFVRLILDLRSGRTEGVSAGFRELARDMGCPTCTMEGLAWAAAAEGRIEEAAALHRELRDRMRRFFLESVSLRFNAALALGPLLEEAGDLPGALEAYRWVVDRWAGADERGMERVREAQARIAALEAEAG